MLSAITMLSSTTIPRTRINPERDIRLMVFPVSPSPKTVPKRVTGILTATQKAVFNERNTPNTTKTRASPM